MQSIEREAVEKTTEKNTSIAVSSIHSESTISQLDQIFTSQTKSHLHVSLFYVINISNIFGQHKNDVAILIYHLPQEWN